MVLCLVGGVKRARSSKAADLCPLPPIRFCRYKKVQHSSIQQTYSRVRDFVEVIMIKDVEIRGKMQKVNIYEVLRVMGSDDNA